MELFDWADPKDISDIFVLGVVGNRYKYILDRHEFDEAGIFFRTFCDNLQNVSEMQRTSFDCDLLFHELTGECRQEEVDRLYSLKLKEFMKFAASEINVQRLIYANERLVSKDVAKTQGCLELFQKTCTSSVWRGTVASERELITMIDKTADERDSQ